MNVSFEHCVTADVALNRRACAKPDLPPGRAYRNNCGTRDICNSWNAARTKHSHLPRSGLAHAAFGGGSARA